MLRTGYMVHLSLEVLPEILDEKQKITRRIIYEKYSRRKIIPAWEKKKEIKAIFKEKFKLNEDQELIQFIEQSGQCLARISHKVGSSKVTISPMRGKFGPVNEFFDHHFYKPTTTCLENKWLEGIIRLLDLNVEIRGKVPSEEITIGFGHDSMKNYFLIRGIMEETFKNCEVQGECQILGEKLIIEDVFLVKFIVEVMKEKEEFRQKLKEIILLSRIQSQNKDQDKRKVVAAANAITILVAGNVGFSAANLSKIRICGANLNDGMFSMADFTEADLSGVILENCKLDGALFYKSIMEEVKLGVYPEIKTRSEILSCCFSADAQTIMAGSMDGCINLWNRSKENQLEMSIGGYTMGVFSQDGKFILTNGGENTLKLWDRTSGALLKSFEGHSKSVNSVCFSADGNFILSGSSDNSIKLWDRISGALLKSFEGHSNWVNSVCFSADRFLKDGKDEFNEIELL